MINYFKKHQALMRLSIVILFTFYIGSCVTSWLYSGQYEGNTYPINNWVAVLAVIWGFHLVWGFISFAVTGISLSICYWIKNGESL